MHCEVNGRKLLANDFGLLPKLQEGVTMRNLESHTRPSPGKQLSAS